MLRLAILMALLLTALPVRAADSTLPRYDMRLKFDTAAHRVDIHQTITWTNRSSTPTQELQINFYPHYRIPEGDYLLLAKTLELLRENPREGIDRNGRAGTIESITMGGQPLEFHYQHDNQTAFVAALPKPVGPGESVTIDLEATLTLPNKQFRWGYWQGISYVTNALPVVAFYDDRGWHAMPFVPWHQPFWNEAGNYTSSITLPADEKLACSAPVKSTTPNADGTVTIVTEPYVGRDFAVLTSKDYKETKKIITLPSGKVVTLKCLAFARHDFYAETLLKFVAEAIPVYSQWFGDFPHDQMTIAESFFGWNGNECSGLVMIDERVFGSPHLAAGYVEYLVSHETCHQWWYDLIGTNGYAETFMDEGAATYFAHRLLDVKHGKKNNFLEWPKQMEWMPNIQRDNYRYGSMYSAIGKDNMPPAAGELPGFKHIIGLFNGAYDRGSKAFGMIEDRLGEAAFLDFTREIVQKYSWKVLQSADYKKELEAYTGRPWDEFYEHWIYGRGLTDWKVNDVKVNDVPAIMSNGRPRSRRVSVIIQQTREYNEPTTLGIQMPGDAGYSIKIPIDPRAGNIQLPEYDTKITTQNDGKIRVEFTLPSDPENIKVDPDNILLDANPGNNAWKNPPRVYATPLMTLLNETDLTNDYDRWNFGAGAWIGGSIYEDPWYVRSTMIGARAAAYRTQVFDGGVYGAYRTDYRDLVIGADGLWDHVPLPNTQLGFNVERRIAGPFGGEDGSDTATRASAFARYIFQYGGSLYLPPMHYIEAYTTYQDNFLPYARTATPGAVRPDWTFLGGIHERLNLYTPYWDPENGMWLDFVYGSGVAQLEKRDTVNELRGELAFVHKLPDWCILGPLADSRIAVRGVAMGALPDQGQFFALGGGTLFRGFDLAERQGSFLWVGNVEWRIPIVRDVEWDTLDHTVGARNIWLATFYDVGAVYANGHAVDGVAHALGAGIRIDTSIFSFIERATLRFDVSKTINAATPFQFWFGVQHAF